MIWLYNLLWLLALPGILCYLFLCRLFMGKYRQNLGPRLGLGLLDQDRPISERLIWVHALSVGEVLSAVPLVRELREEFPGYHIVVSTTSESGQLIARQKLASLGCHFLYLPLDLWWLARRVTGAVGASLFVVVETDLWPNLFRYLKREKTPIILVNGRLSDRSFSRYSRLRRFSGLVFRNLDALCLQSHEDARRMRMLGVEATRIRVTGNLKFDQILQQAPGHERQELISELGWPPYVPVVWIAGSTHPGEEGIILRVYSQMRQRFSNFCLVLAPRNPERFAEVGRLAEQTGWKTARRTQQVRGKGSGKAVVDVLILDTVGELARFYSLGSFAFVGGSFVTVGGHNPLEAAQRGLPVVFGPHMENFREIARILKESGGAFEVKDEAGLRERVEVWLMVPEACRKQGEEAQAALLVHQGAVARNIEVVRSLLGTEQEQLQALAKQDT